MEYLLKKEDAAYPKLLKEIHYPPDLYIKGKLSDQPAVAIVGTRKATKNGRLLAQKLAYELSKQGIIIVSGLAMGIDASAHQGAVEAGGPTWAVLATGLDRVYPAQNSNLAGKILETGGTLISEYPAGQPSFPSNFVHRNRIVSGLSSAVVIIEAPEKSGALITAQFALEQNREVLVVPGPADHPNYAGSHQLIRAGAQLAVSAKEIMQELNWEYKNPVESKSTKKIFDNEEKIILETIHELGWPAPIDKIAQITKIEVPKINQVITLLTLRGVLKS